MAIFSPIVEGQTSRRPDRWGHGLYGATRDKGSRPHLGLDIVVYPGQKIHAPIPGIVTREAKYSDPRFRGIDLQGADEWAEYLVRMLYLDGSVCGFVQSGDVVGVAQDISQKYNGMTPHVHLQVRYQGKWIDPFDVYQLCF